MGYGMIICKAIARDVSDACRCSSAVRAQSMQEMYWHLPGAGFYTCPYQLAVKCVRTPSLYLVFEVQMAWSNTATAAVLQPSHLLT